MKFTWGEGLEDKSEGIEGGITKSNDYWKRYMEN